MTSKEACMKIVIVSGFLGSGKTTSVIKLGKRLQKNGLSVSVIVNDIADVGVDGQFISRKGLESKELPKGCICCTQKYALTASIAMVHVQQNPDILLIEPSGVAFPARIKEQVQKLDHVSMGPVIGLIDGSKFEDLMQHSEDAITKQIENADFVLLNKKDMLSTYQLSEFETAITEINPDATLHSLSLKLDDGSFTNFADSLARNLKDDSYISGMNTAITNTNETSDQDSDILDPEFNHFNVNSYAHSYPINEFSDQDQATQMALDLIESIKKSILELNPRFMGHLKMILQTDSIALKVSVTSYRDQPEIDSLSIEGNEDSKMTVFAAVTDVARDNLAEIIQSAVSAELPEWN